MSFAEIGFGLTAFGMFFTFLGVLMFFDQALLAMGNLMFLIGITLTIGTNHVLNFFLARKKLRVRPCSAHWPWSQIVCWS